MVINEKAIVRQMKDAYKSYGYTVAVDEDAVYLTNGFWLAELDINQVPSEIMGMFGQHIRDIPRSGDAYKVIKDKSGPIVQTRILKEALGVVEQMLDRRATAFASGSPVKMRKTNLNYNNLQVWQAKIECDVFLIDPRYAVLFEKTAEVYRVGQGIYAEDADSRLWVLRVNEDSDKAYLEHLQEISWVKE